MIRDSNRPNGAEHCPKCKSSLPLHYKLEADTVAYIIVEYTAGGMVKTDGHYGDKRMALLLLDHGRDAIKRVQRPEDNPLLMLPNVDVQVAQHANYPTVPRGDMR